MRLYAILSKYLINIKDIIWGLFSLLGSPDNTINLYEWKFAGIILKVMSKKNSIVFTGFNNCNLVFIPKNIILCCLFCTLFFILI